MAEQPSAEGAIVPAEFHQHNYEKFQRTVRLTRQAIYKLQQNGKTVTLAALSEATRAFDERGNGLTAATILRNQEACALFHLHSPAYQQRQKQIVKLKRKYPRSKGDMDTRAAYRGIHRSELIQMIEDLKGSLTELETQKAQLQAARDEAREIRNEARQQNTLQLAVLTQLTGQVKS